MVEDGRGPRLSYARTAPAAHDRNPFGSSSVYLVAAYAQLLAKPGLTALVVRPRRANRDAEHLGGFANGELLIEHEVQQVALTSWQPSKRPFQPLRGFGADELRCRTRPRV